jgi:hypothetical protein
MRERSSSPESSPVAADATRAQGSTPVAEVLSLQVAAGNAGSWERQPGT